MGLSEQEWQEGYELWLSSRNSDATRRSYQDAWRSMFSYVGKHPSEIRKPDIARWVSWMKSKGLTSLTIRTRLAIVHSYYGYMREMYFTTDDQGVDVPAVELNPVDGVKRPPARPKEEIYYLNAAQVKALLGAIPRNTIQGLRDYALFFAYIALGKRNSEIRKLRWGDFEERDGRIYFRWSGKGKSGKKECPEMVFTAIVDYLKAADLWKNIRNEDYIFIPLNLKARNLPNIADDWEPWGCLSARAVGKQLKHYARLAGLDDRRLHVHCLRHTATMLRLQAGDGLLEVSSFLDHSSVDITTNYIHQLTGAEDKSWSKVELLLGL